MERLTERFMHGLGVKDCYDSCSVCDVAVCCGLLEEMLEKLAHYEDLEEQGKLIELPRLPDEEVRISNIGYTQEEAEAKLKEMEGME